MLLSQAVTAMSLIVTVTTAPQAPVRDRDLTKRNKNKASPASSTASPPYWWLQLAPSPFGGRNYNFEEIQRGEHIGKTKTKERKVGRGRQREVKMVTKRQADYFGDSDAEYFQDFDDEYKDSEAEYEDNILAPQEEQGGVIPVEDIKSECPAGSSCVETFYCASFTGNSPRDKIPCLLSSGDFAGDFGICCKFRHPRVCPRLRDLPSPESCLPRPLGVPEDNECLEPGTQSSCAADTLCCFNGCINVCLEDPPYKVDKSFWVRKTAELVSRNPSKKTEELITEDMEEYDYSEENFFNNSEEDELNISRVDRILLKLIRRLRSRISS